MWVNDAHDIMNRRFPPREPILCGADSYYQNSMSFLVFVLLFVAIAHFSEIKRFLHFKNEYCGLGRVHTTPEKFENVALFLRLDLLSTLIRHQNEALFLRLDLLSTLIRHENEALFPRLDLLSTLIRHEKGTLRIPSSNWRDLKTQLYFYGQTYRPH